MRSFTIYFGNLVNTVNPSLLENYEEEYEKETEVDEEMDEEVSEEMGENDEIEKGKEKEKRNTRIKAK